MTIKGLQIWLAHALDKGLVQQRLALPLAVLQQQLAQLGKVAHSGEDTAVGALDTALAAGPVQGVNGVAAHTERLPQASGQVLADGQAFFLGQRASFWGRMLGPVVALILSLYGLPLVLLVTGLGFFAFAISARFWMTERGFHKGDHERKFWATFREGWSVVRLYRLLFLVLLVSVFFGFASEGFDRLWNKIFLDTFALPKVGPFDDTFWWSLFGILTQAGGMGLNIGLSKVVDTTSTTSITRALIALTSVLIFSLLGFALTSSFALAIGFYVVSRSIRRMLDPLLTTWTNLYAPKKYRATILSFASQSHSLGEIGGGPVVGFIGQKVSATMAVVTAAFLLTPTLAVLFAAKKHSKAVDLEAQELGS